MKKLKKAHTRLHRIAFKIYHNLATPLNPIPMSYMETFNVLYRKRLLTEAIRSTHY